MNGISIENNVVKVSSIFAILTNQGAEALKVGLVEARNKILQEREIKSITELCNQPTIPYQVINDNVSGGKLLEQNQVYSDGLNELELIIKDVLDTFPNYGKGDGALVWAILKENYKGLTEQDWVNVKDVTYSLVDFTSRTWMYDIDLIAKLVFSTILRTPTIPF